jgi:kelch-like protein 38
MPDARSHHATVAVGSAIYVLGGFGDDVANDDNVGVPIATAVFKFDSALGTWIKVAPMVAPRSDFAACAVGKDLYVFGGFDDFRLGKSNTVSKYDTVANEWSILAPMPGAHSYHSASVLDGLVYIVAGGHDVLQFDPTSGVWSTLAPTSVNRFYGVSFVIGDHLYAAGGQHEVSVERYDLATNTWTAVADMLEARAFSCPVTMESEEQNLFDTLIMEATERL